MNTGKLICILGLTLTLSGCGDDSITQIKNSDFCDGSELSFEDTLSLKYDDGMTWKQFESSDGQDVVEVNAKSKAGETFRMQYLIQTAASGKIVPKPNYIEINGKQTSVFGLLSLCM